MSLMSYQGFTTDNTMRVCCATDSNDKYIAHIVNAHPDNKAVSIFNFNFIFWSINQ